MEKLRLLSKPRDKSQSQGLPVEEIVFDFIEECEIPLMEVNSDIDVEQDMPSFLEVFFDEAMKLLFKQ